eukprot:scaffold7116_cov296-Pinguiococcus_pyrenoidosus.AAC.2
MLLRSRRPKRWPRLLANPRKPVAQRPKRSKMLSLSHVGDAEVDAMVSSAAPGGGRGLWSRFDLELKPSRNRPESRGDQWEAFGWSRWDDIGCLEHHLANG